MDANQSREEGEERVKDTNGQLDSKWKCAMNAYDPTRTAIFRNEIENLRT